MRPLPLAPREALSLGPMLHLALAFARAALETTRARLRRGPALPSWDYGFECIITMLRNDYEATRDWPYPKLRKELEARPLPKDALRKVERHAERLGALPAERFSVAGAPSSKGVLFFHGGSYLFGSTRTHADVMARLALASGYPVWGIDYRLAPEHRYPAQLEDALAAVDALGARGVTLPRLVLAGDSAGGNLALVTQLALRDRGAQAAGALLLSPWLDLSASQPSCQSAESFDWGSHGLLLHMARAVAGPLALEDPRLSPLFVDPRGLAPALVLAGTAERLFDECVLWVDKCRAAGVDCALERLHEMPHNALTLAGYHREGARGVEVAARFLRERLERPAAALA